MSNTLRVCASCGFIIVDFNTQSDNRPPAGYLDITHGSCNDCIVGDLMDNGSTLEQANAFVLKMEGESKNDQR